MISDVTKRWIEAGKQLAKDKNNKVKCPKCGEFDLKVEDIVFEKSPELFERIMYCPNCGEKNSMRMKK